MTSQTADHLITYPFDRGLTPTDAYRIRVDGHPVAAYDSLINAPDDCALCIFDITGPVRVEITVPMPLQSVKVRPASAGICAAIDGQTFSFELTQPRKLCIEINGSLAYPLFLFVSQPEQDAPSPDDPNVIYFGSGLHEPGKVMLQEGQTAYLAGGAVVRGHFAAKDVHHVRILGRGILDASANRASMITMTRCTDVLIEGVTILKQPPFFWTTSFWSCDDLRISNLKILAGDSFSNDGIDLVSCHRALVEDCFVKCYDDCIVVKAFHTDGRTAENITVRKCLLWNIQAYGVNIGPELHTTEVRDITITDCDIINPQHTETDPNDDYFFYCGVLGIVNGGDAVVSNVLFDDIRIENPTAKLISIKIMKEAVWNKGCTAYGEIRDVLFRNVRVLDGPFLPSEILSNIAPEGYNRAEPERNHIITNITFENLRILGTPIRSAQQGCFIVNPHARGLRFIVTDDAAGHTPA